MSQNSEILTMMSSGKLQTLRLFVMVENINPINSRSVFVNNVTVGLPDDSHVSEEETLS